MKKQVDICFKITTYEYGTVWIDVDKIDPIETIDDCWAGEMYFSANINEMRTDSDLVVNYIHAELGEGITEELYAR